MNERYAARRERLRPEIRKKGFSALLVSHAANRYYLSGFELHDPQCNESAGFLLVTADGRDRLLTDPRYLDAARRVWPEDDIFIYSGKKLEAIRAYLKDAAGGTIGVEAAVMSLELHSKLSESLTLEPTMGMVEKLRVIKDEDELAAMERSCELNHKLMGALGDILIPGRTEKQCAWEIEKFFREHGASGMAFDSIVGVGPNGALPHAIPDETVIPEEGSVLVDTGCRLDDYCSDQTRTVWVGESPSDRFKRSLDQVREAQQAAIDAIRPGVRVADAYAAARKVFEKHGVEQFFTHALGHGIGLETHEPPSLSPVSEDTLKPGMVVTAEPGLYYADWAGFRWEHMVVVTEDGCRTF